MFCFHHEISSLAAGPSNAQYSKPCSTFG
jgi:hypothetical protein